MAAFDGGLITGVRYGKGALERPFSILNRVE
jgi:hypothetical protein